MTVLFTVVCHINAFIIGEDVCIEFPNTLKTNDLEKHKNLKLILTTGNVTLMVFCQSNSPSLALSSNTVILRDWHFQWIPHIVCKNDTYIYIRVCNYAWVCDECKIQHVMLTMAMLTCILLCVAAVMLCVSATSQGITKRHYLQHQLLRLKTKNVNLPVVLEEK